MKVILFQGAHMTKHIFISKEGNDNSISVFNIEPVVIVIADRKDLSTISKLEEAHIPGIYILLGEDKRYVGQASGEIINRLLQHDKNKDWWHKVIFFGREDGHLDKSQTDYLEHKLITKFNDLGLPLDNGTAGNLSYIDKLSKSKANEMLSIVEDTLLNVVNLDLFEVEDDEQADDHLIEENLGVYIRFNGQSFTQNSARKAYGQLMEYIFTKPIYREKLSRFITDGKPTTVEFVGQFEKISDRGVKLTRELKNGEHLYVNFSRSAIENKFNLVADQLGMPIEVSFS